MLIHGGKSVANCASVNPISREHFGGSLWKFVMKANCRRIKTPQRYRIFKVFKK